MPKMLTSKLWLVLILSNSSIRFKGHITSESMLYFIKLCHGACQQQSGTDSRDL